jgi:hypothetical protein
MKKEKEKLERKLNELKGAKDSNRSGRNDHKHAPDSD